MEMRSGSKLLSEKMQSRCAFSWWFADPKKLPAPVQSSQSAVHPPCACTVPKRSPTRAGAETGQILRALGRHQLLGVTTSPGGCRSWVPAEQAWGVTGHLIPGQRLFSCLKKLFYPKKKGEGQRHKVLLLLRCGWEMLPALNLEYCSFSFFFPSVLRQLLFVFQQPVPWGWRKFFLQVDNISRWNPQVGRLQSHFVLMKPITNQLSPPKSHLPPSSYRCVPTPCLPETWHSSPRGELVQGDEPEGNYLLVWDVFCLFRSPGGGDPRRQGAEVGTPGIARPGGLKIQIMFQIWRYPFLPHPLYCNETFHMLVLWVFFSMQNRDQRGIFGCNISVIFYVKQKFPD